MRKNLGVVFGENLKLFFENRRNNVFGRSSVFGNLYKKDKVFCMKIFKHYIYSLSKILRDLGININTIPVLDVLRNNTNKIIDSVEYNASEIMRNDNENKQEIIDKQIIRKD